MKKLVGVAVLAAVLAVSGCAAGAESAGQDSAAETATQPTSAPITMTAEAPEPTATDSPYGEYTQDEFFVKGAAFSWRGELPTDAQFIAAGHAACDALAAGTPKDEVRAVEGDSEDAKWNNTKITQYAIQVYCPQFNG